MVKRVFMAYQADTGKKRRDMKTWLVAVIVAVIPLITIPAEAESKESYSRARFICEGRFIGNDQGSTEGRRDGGLCSPRQCWPDTHRNAQDIPWGKLL
jgi:hypothetical protein